MAYDPKRRKVLLINPKFQWSFLGYTVAIAFSNALIFFLANQYFFSRFIAKGKLSGLRADDVFFRFIAEQQRTMNWIFAFTALASFVVILYFGMHLSNRVAGPLFNLKRYLDRKREGKSSGPLKFRKGDYFIELEESVNQLFSGDSKVPEKTEKVEASGKGQAA